MATRPLENVLAYVRTLVRESAAEAETDGQLLERFIVHGDHAAFTALVSRYAPLVFGVCQRILGDHHEAEDAFQAAGRGTRPAAGHNCPDTAWAERWVMPCFPCAPDVRTRTGRGAMKHPPDRRPTTR